MKIKERLLLDIMKENIEARMAESQDSINQGLNFLARYIAEENDFDKIKSAQKLYREAKELLSRTTSVAHYMELEEEQLEKFEILEMINFVRELNSETEEDMQRRLLAKTKEITKSLYG